MPRTAILLRDDATDTMAVAKKMPRPFGSWTVYELTMSNPTSEKAERVIVNRPLLKQVLRTGTRVVGRV